MEAYIKNLEGRRISEEDARRQMFRDFGIAALKGGSRDFFQNIGGAAEAAMANQAATKKANQQLEDMAQQQRLDMVKYQDARKEGRLKEAEALNERIYDRRNKMLTQATGLAALQDQLATGSAQRQKIMADIAQGKESSALLPYRIELLKEQIRSMKSPAEAGGVRANDYRQAYRDVMESDGRKLESDLKKRYEALAGKNFMQNSVHAANFQQDLDDEIKKRIFARFGVTDPKMQRVIQDVPKRAAVLGD
jgi:chorismate mutase